MLVCLLAAVTLQNLAVSAFDLWKGDKCSFCLDVPIADLITDGEDSYVGCDPKFDEGKDSFPTLPLCSLKAGAENVQAGGHADTFHVLNDNKVAKQVLAFDTLPGDASGKTKRNKIAARTEYEVYMNFWCLKKLSRKPLQYFVESKHVEAEKLRRDSSPHLFHNFVFDGCVGCPWAPAFYGLCKVQYEKSSTAYIIMENLMSSYRKPSQLDLKVGRTIEPGAAAEQGYRKTIKKTMFDALSPTGSTGARLAGYKVWDYKQKKYQMMTSKAYSPLMSLSSVFQTSFDERHWGNEDFTLSTLANRIEGMSLWWNQVGIKQIHSIAASLLFVYEGAEDDQPKAGPTLKIIDYAHFFAWDVHPDWGDDLTYTGLTSAMGELDRILGDDAKLEKTIWTSPFHRSFTEVCGQKKTCSVKCPIVVENPPATLRAFVGISKPRCARLAVAGNQPYYSWRRVNKGECRICSSTVPRNGAMFYAKWDKAWAVYTNTAETTTTTTAPVLTV